MSMHEPLAIEVNSLSQAFGATRAVDGIDLSVWAGKCWRDTPSRCML